MRILIVKTSSMGDVIHTLPALTDAARVHPDIVFDWVVEEGFQEIPRWHSHVKEVIPIALRRWRKNIFAKKTYHEWRQFYQKLREKQYDFIIDAQGLLKSAAVTFFAKGVRCGFSIESVREPIASFCYQKKASVKKNQHAIQRVRHLFSQILGYDLPDTVPEYGIDRKKLLQNNPENYLVFLHGTTWDTKHWPEASWIELATLAAESGIKVKLPWGNAVEEKRAQAIAKVHHAIEVLPKLNLKGIAEILAGAKAIVAVDTGLGHLAAALDVPTISLYGPTNPSLTGALGQSQVHLTAEYACAPCLRKSCLYDEATPPCFATLSAQRVWAELKKILVEY